MTNQETALELCQKIGMVTMFDPECNEGRTLPLHVVKKIAILCIDELRKQPLPLDELKKEIEIL